MRGRRRWIVVSLILAGLSVGTLAALVATRYYPAYRSALEARDDLRKAQALLRERRLDAGVADLAAVTAHLDNAERGFRHARRAFDDPLLRTAQRVPLLGGSLKATVLLLDIGREGAELGRATVAMSRSYQEERDRGRGALNERAEEIVSKMNPSVTAIKERLGQMGEKRAQVTGSALPPPLVDAVRELDGDLVELHELVRTYDDLSAFVPEFLGFNGPRTYLVLAQNNAELLPTGGLISVYGVISIEDGRIQEQHFEDAVSFGGRWLERSGVYVEPPAPLQRYLLRDFSWNFAVSNWSPDFPTAAWEAERFFRLAGGRRVDGVIAINVHTIEGLLRVTGPFTVESYRVTVSAENALDVIEEHTRSASEPDTDRKAFVGLLAEELLSRLTETPAERWTQLVEALERLRDGRQILLFSHDPKVQALAHRLALDGALERPEGDYFMLVDASVNSTKLNIVLEQSIDLTVRLDAQRSAYHDARIAYRNNLPVWSKGRDPVLVRRLMLGGLYGGYVRLLAPRGSLLEDMTLAGRQAGAEEIGAERGKAVFGRFFSLASGQETELGFRYVTPSAIRVEDGRLVYRLYLQKQSGTSAIPLRLQIMLPRGARSRSAELDGEPLESLDRIETDLSEDRELIVRYELDD